MTEQRLPKRIFALLFSASIVVAIGNTGLLSVLPAIGREIAQFETMIRDAARAVADRLGVDFREVRRIMMDQWRDHRASRRDHLSAEADAAVMTEAEQAEDD